MLENKRFILQARWWFIMCRFLYEYSVDDTIWCGISFDSLWAHDILISIWREHSAPPVAVLD